VQRTKGRGASGLPALETEPGAVPPIDEDDRTVTKGILVVCFLQIALGCFYQTCTIPTARQYAEELNAPAHFDAYTVGAVSIGSAVIQPLYRWLLSKSFAATMHFQLVCIQLGSILYSLAQVAGKMELLVVGRLLGGFGASQYPIYQFIAESVGKNHRSKVISLVSGFGKSFGFALGPIFAACVANVDFQLGDMVVDKETNPGWMVALLCVVQIALVVWVFPREGSKLIGKEKLSADLPESAAPNFMSLKAKVFHYFALSYVVLMIALSNAFLSAWQLAATKVIQLTFEWSVQWSAVLVGGICFTPAFVTPLLGRLSYKFQDRTILLFSCLAQLLSCVLLFDYGTPIPYLIGGLLIFNAMTSEVMFSLSLSTKVAFLSEVDVVMSVIGLSTISRLPGFMLGSYLAMDELAGTFLAGSLLSVLGACVFFKKLVPT